MTFGMNAMWLKTILAGFLILVALPVHAQLIRKEMIENSDLIVKHNLTATVAPETYDDSDDNYSVGSVWLDTVAGNIYQARSVGVGAADWVCISCRGLLAGDSPSWTGTHTWENAASCATGVFVGDDNRLNGGCIYWHASQGFTINPVVAGVENDADRGTRLAAGKKSFLKDRNGNDLVSELENTDGYYSTERERSGNPGSNPATGYWHRFFKADGMYIMDDAGNVTGPMLSAGAIKTVSLVVFAPATTIATGDGKAVYTIPSTLNGYNLTAVSGSILGTVSSSGAINVTLTRCATVATGNPCSGTTAAMLSTALTIDANEEKSSTAAAPAVIDGANDDVATDQRVRVDVDGAGTGAAGLEITLKFQLP